MKNYRPNLHSIDTVDIKLRELIIYESTNAFNTVNKAEKTKTHWVFFIKKKDSSNLWFALTSVVPRDNKYLPVQEKDLNLDKESFLRRNKWKSYTVCIGQPEKILRTTKDKAFSHWRVRDRLIGEIKNNFWI